MVTSQIATAGQVSAEQVDIFNGDQLLGRASVVGGQWTYSPSGLSVGEYNLIARFGGIGSTRWRFSVIESTPGLEKFDDIPVGSYKELHRPDFDARWIASALNPEPMRIVLANGIDGMEGHCLEVHGFKGVDDDFSFPTTVFLKFTTPCDKFRFRCVSVNSGVSGDRQVHATAWTTNTGESKYFTDWNSGSMHVVEFGPYQEKITNADIFVGSPPGITESLYLDNFEFITLS
jgi:hypothetical protein